MSKCNTNFNAGNSQETARFGLPPFVRSQIDLVGDRQNGQTFPQFGGESLYIERCDYPVLLAFVQNGVSQAVAAHEGLEIRAPFKGLTVFHDSIAAFGAGATALQPKLTLLQSTLSGFMSNDLARGQTRTPPPYNVVATTGVGASYVFSFPVPEGYRSISSLYMSLGVANQVAAFDGDLQCDVFFSSQFGSSFIAPVTKNGVAYATPTTLSAMRPATFQRPAALTVRAWGEFSDIPIPSWANIGIAAFRFGAGNNVTAFGGTNNDLQVYFS